MTRIAHAFSVNDLVAAWGHVLTLSEDLRTEERARRLAVAAQFAQVFSAALVPDEHGSVDGTPSEEERALYTLLASMTVRADAESARTIWEPILAAGAPAHYWVDNFIDDVWITALADDVALMGFVPLIKAMMAFADSEESWRAGGDRESLELALLCVGRFGYPRMADRHRPLLDALQPEWSELAAANMRSAYGARPIVSFLGEPVAAGLVDAGLGWLAKRERAEVRPDADLDEAIAELLESSPAVNLGSSGDSKSPANFSPRLLRGRTLSRSSSVLVSAARGRERLRSPCSVGGCRLWGRI